MPACTWTLVEVAFLQGPQPRLEGNVLALNPPYLSLRARAFSPSTRLAPAVGLAPDGAHVGRARRPTSASPFAELSGPRPSTEGISRDALVPTCEPVANHWSPSRTGRGMLGHVSPRACVNSVDRGDGGSSFRST